MSWCAACGSEDCDVHCPYCWVVFTHDISAHLPFCPVQLHVEPAEHHGEGTLICMLCNKELELVVWRSRQPTPAEVVDFDLDDVDGSLVIEALCPGCEVEQALR